MSVPKKSSKRVGFPMILPDAWQQQGYISFAHRRFREIHVATQQMMVSDSILELVGRLMVGLETDVSQLEGRSTWFLSPTILFQYPE